MTAGFKFCLALLISWQALLVPVWAQPNSSESPKPRLSEVIYLIDAGLEQHHKEIQTQASQLNLEERQLIYELKARSPVLPFLLNFFLGLGLGSFISGDIEGGLIEVGGETVSALALMLFVGNLYPQIRQDPDSPAVWTLGGAALISLLIMLSFRLFGFIRPFSYSENYNQRLRNSLDLRAPKLHGGIIDRQGSVGVRLNWQF